MSGVDILSPKIVEGTRRGQITANLHVGEWLLPDILQTSLEAGTNV